MKFVALRSGWVVVGGCLLAMLSAAVNAGFVIHLGASVSHLTGDFSRVAIETIDASATYSEPIVLLMSAVIGFVGGAAVAGYFIHHPTLEFSRPYGRCVTGIGVALLVSHRLMGDQPWAAVMLASLACGLQNALATHYRGLILRTTHVTGLLTDLGANLGMKLRGHSVARWKILVPLVLATSFLVGSLCGAGLVLWLALPFLQVIGLAYIVGGAGWSIFKRLNGRRAV